MANENLLGELIRIGIGNGEFPKSLYKYYAINEDTVNTIKEPYLWYNSLDKYNDPYEGQCNPRRDYTIDEINEWMARISHSRYVSVEQFNTGLDHAIRLEIRSSRVCCFSKKNDEILMWAHYADSNRGICVEYDLEKLSDYVGFLAAVKYETMFPIVDYLNNNVETIKQMVLTKSKDWEYEQEIRALRDNGTENKVHIPKDAIKSIIFGPKAQTDTEFYRELMEAIPKTIRLFKCEVDKSKYKLNIVPYSK